MTDDEQGIAVIICAHSMDRWHILCETIASVEKQTLQPREIILVVDHNQELLDKALATFPSVSIVKNQEARGLSGARNTGISESTTQLLAFIDDDAIARPDWLLELVRQSEPADVLGVTGLIQPLWLGTRPDWLPDEFLWVVGCSYRGLPVTMAEVRNVMGCSMLIKRKVFEQAGMFLHGLGRSELGVGLQSCEETELCVRAGMKIPNSRFVFAPSSVVLHHIHESRLSWRYFRRRCFAEGLSKAKLTAAIGCPRTLSAERSYVWHTLSIGFFRGLKEAVIGKRKGALKRSTAILTGLSYVILGYVFGKLPHHDFATAPTPSEMVP
jgi:GT2 family glycosyltransferase